jgi:AmmeMemoRadiSam system protein B
MGGVRPPAVAGTFYPGDAAALTTLVDGLLEKVPLASDESLARAYVVPHAGLRYSGPTAAHSYARLRSAAGAVRRVVLIGPAHYVALQGCAVPTAARWAMPLGEIAIDTDGCAALASAGLAAADDAPHAPEHSLEVQLPFVARTLGEAITVLPIVAGPSTVESVADVIAAAVSGDDTGTVVLCSTDLSHYLDDPTARAQDSATLDSVERLTPDAIGARDACGVYALRGLLGWAARENLAARRLDYSTSADTGGDPGRVVGYSAFAFA